MKIGTRSVLYGAHCFFIHPWFVALGWWKLYGFPWAPWLWAAFFVHDLGYIGKPNMDGDEGERHPFLGARLLTWLQTFWLWFMDSRRTWDGARVMAAAAHLDGRANWGRECLLHSRFWAKKAGAQPSRLCWADKMAMALEPWWLYLPRVTLTGEIEEYRARQRAGERDSGYGELSGKAWVLSMKKFTYDLAMQSSHDYRFKKAS